jgi:predicted nucleotide-binding protein
MGEYPERYWHCRVKKAHQNKEVSLRDLTFAELQSRIIAPYKGGRRFPIENMVVSAGDIDEIQIVHTIFDDEYNSERFYNQIRQDNERSLVVAVAIYPGPFGLEDATDYTHALLFSDDMSAEAQTEPQTHPKLLGIEVFVVHGHDDALRSEVCRTLEKLGLEPIVLFEQADKGRTIIEKFEEHSDVAYAVVLVTPDDEGRLRGEKQISPRARQNVIFELGFFYGKLSRQRVCAILKEGVEFPSDISGVIYKKADAAGAWKFELAKEMKAAGLEIDFNKL